MFFLIENGFFIKYVIAQVTARIYSPENIAPIAFHGEFADRESLIINVATTEEECKKMALNVGINLCATSTIRISAKIKTV